MEVLNGRRWLTPSCGARARPRRRARACQQGNVVPVRDALRRRLRDAGLGLPEAARGDGPVLPARVCRAGAARPLLLPRLPPTGGAALERRGCCRSGAATAAAAGAADPSSEPPTPTRAVAEHLGRFRLAPVEDLPPFAGGAVGFFGYDLVRTVEPLGEPNPDPLGLPDMALMITDVDGRLRPPAPRADDPRLRLRRRRGRHRRRLRAGRRGDRRWSASGCAAPVPGAGRAPSVAEPPRVRLQHDPGAVRGGRRADRRVRPRRRRLPGRALAALQRAGPGRGLLDLPRPARGQPLALHVLPRVRRLPDRRRLAGAAGQGHRRPGRDAADRRHLPARAQRGGGPPPRRAPDRRPQGARRARDAGRPRPQRPRPRLRVRHRSASTS